MIETGEVFRCAKEAALTKCVVVQAIYQSINRRRKCAGVHWEYVDES